MAGIAGPMLPEIASKIPFPIDFSVIFSFAAETGSLSVLSKSPSSHSSLYTSFYLWTYYDLYLSTGSYNT